MKIWNDSFSSLHFVFLVEEKRKQRYIDLFYIKINYDHTWFTVLVFRVSTMLLF